MLLVNFPDNPTEPWTVNEANELVFGIPNDFFLENSFGQTWLSGDVYGWFTIPVNSSTCDTFTIALEARLAAAAAGIDPSAYNRYVYAFPDINCPFSGMATIGGNPSQTWFDGTLRYSAIVIHELGHNFGLNHSHAMSASAGC